MLDAIMRGIGVAGELYNSALNREQARETAQNSISWRVADARRAGIHPLYALGAPTMNLPPSSVGNLAENMGRMGQDISRAVMGNATEPERQGAIGGALGELALERAGLQNDLLRAQIASLASRVQSTPAAPSLVDQNVIPGQGNSGLVKVEPAKTEASSAPGQSGAIPPEVMYSRGLDGSLFAVPSKTVKDSIEDVPGVGWEWLIRNRLAPRVTSQGYPQADPGEGKVWVMHPGWGAWYAVPRDSWIARLFGNRRVMRGGD